MQKAKAAGSLWNPGSWHWEMKNCSQRTKLMLEERILAQEIAPAEGFTLRHSKVVYHKAEAEINIRKGKPIFLFDFELELTLTCDYKDHDSQGSYHAKEILNDSLDDIIIEDIKAKEKNAAGDELKKWVRKNARAFLEKTLNEMQKEILLHESDPQRLEEDKKKREANLEAVQKAREENGAEKQRLLEEQKAKQRALKLEAQMKDLEMHQAQNPCS